MNQKNILAYISFFTSKAGNPIALIYVRQLSADKLADNPNMTIRWKPSATVAAIIEQNGKFLLVEEHTPEGLRLNNPAGHLDQGEGLIEACAREALEETMHTFEPTDLIGVYTSRFIRPAQGSRLKQDVTYLRFAFCGALGPLQPERKLDTGIVRTLWLTPDEIRASSDRHRSPLVVSCMEDYLTGRRFPLNLIHTDQSVTALRAQADRT
jgi:ADP-ribose pyrophosphatase YjhB (NUDIX family)